MKQCVKRYLAVILTLAMVFTMIPSTLVRAEGEEGGVVGTTQTVKASKFVSHNGGNQTGENVGSYFVSVQDNSKYPTTVGDKFGAAYREGETASSAKSTCGNLRVAGLGFELSNEVKALDTDLIEKAVLTINVPNVSNLETKHERWTKAGLLSVDASKYAEMSDDEASFPARGDDYSYEATVYSNEQIAEGQIGKKTFDVTEWIKKSITEGDDYAVYRIQTVMSGFYITYEGDNAPTLSITALTPQEAVEQAKAGIKLPVSTRDSITLPATGEYNTTITWESKNPGIMGNDGSIVSLPAENTDVELEATITRGDVTAKGTFTVKVLGAEVPSVLETAIANYDFNDFQATDDSTLVDSQQRELKLEAVGAGVKPELVSVGRGKVLSLTEQDYGNRAYALLPSNPFAGQSIENGLTLSFWTKSKATPEGGRCLIDFEVAPATTGRAGTYAVNQHYVYWNTTDQNEQFMDFQTSNLNLTPANGWTMVTMVVTKDDITFYRNNAKIEHKRTSQKEVNHEQMIKDLVGAGGLVENPADTKVRIGASLATYWSCAGAWIDDISFYGKALSEDEIKALYDETYVDLSLKGVAIAGQDKVAVGNTIQLTTVLDPVDAAVSASAKWESDNEAVLTVNGSGVVRGVAAGKANVTVTIDGITSAKYEVEVGEPVKTLEGNKYYLTVYSTEKPFHAANKRRVAQETRSVYMAVSDDGKNFDVLNSGGGVIFAKNGSKEITAPRIYKENGGFKIVAPDGEASRGFHIFTSKDGVNYYDQTLVSSTDLAAFPLDKASFKLLLKGENILESDSTITLGNVVELTKEEYTYVVNKLGTVVNNGLEKLSDVDATSAKNTDEILGMLQKSVNATFTDGSVQEFNIDWSEALKGVDLSKAGTYELTGKVIQTKYLNNLKELNGSNLPEDDPSRANPDYPDNYNPQTGEVYYDSTKFVEGMADPCIFWDEQTGYYYMTGSYFPENGDAMPGETPEQYDRVVLRRGRTLEDLQDRSKQVTIWKVGNQGYIDNGNQIARGYRYIWAPEIHRVGNYWVIYFTESHASNNAFNIYSHALILDGDKDPYETALKASNEVSQWQDYKMCREGDFTDPFATAFCLDMTYFKDEKNGKSYVIWAGKPSIGNTDLHIATVSEEEPWKITSPATSITQPEYGWEVVDEVVNEGPTVLQKDGNIFLCYSGAGTGSEYAIGMLSAKNGEDLLSKDNWTKSPYPVLTSRDVNGEEGPGHNSFTVDKDGNVIFVYHARPTSHNYQKCGWNGTSSSYNGSPLNDPCRHARLKRVHWAADGTPILKMTYDNELLEENQTVKVNVKISAGVTDVVPVTGVTLDQTTLNLTVGGTADLKATVLPDNATDKTVTWSSDKESVATVANGKVTAVAAGTAKITATAGGKTATCEVTVTNPVVEAASVTLDKRSLTMYVKDKAVALKATVAPANATNKAVTWESSNIKVAKVSANGSVTPVAKGTATITAKTANGKTATCKVTVKVHVSKVKLSKTKATIGVKESLILKATVSPSTVSSTDKKVTWKSSNTKLATVSSKGVVKAKKAGTVKITAKADGKSATCTITIQKAPTKITAKKTNVSLKRKGTYKIKYTLKPSGARNKVTYTSNKPKIAKVSSKGVITGVKKGTAKITVKTYNGKKATITVKVK